MNLFSQLKNGWHRLITFITGLFSKDEQQYSANYLYNAIKAQLRDSYQRGEAIRLDSTDADSALYLTSNKMLLMATYTDEKIETSKGTLNQLNKAEQVNDIAKIVVLIAQNGKNMLGLTRRHWTVLEIIKNSEHAITVNSYDPKSKWGSLLYDRRHKLYKQLSQVKDKIKTIFNLSDCFQGLDKPQDLNLLNLGVQNIFNKTDCGPYVRQIITDLVQNNDPMAKRCQYDVNSIRGQDQANHVSNMPTSLEAMINPMNNSTTYRQWMISSQHSSDSAAVRATKNFNQESPRNPQRVVERDNITKAQDNKAEGELVRPQNQNRQ